MQLVVRKYFPCEVTDWAANERAARLMQPVAAVAEKSLKGETLLLGACN